VAWNSLQALARNPHGYRWLMKRSGFVAWSERAVRRFTGDRLGVLDLVGIPSAQVIAVGRRTGRARTTTLQLIKDGEEFLVVGSNWGSADDPGWVHNLAATRVVDVRRRGDRFEAEVRELTGDERARAWTTIVAAWPNYEIAQSMAGARTFRIFALRPT
jgi:deazaflavin-dependent oxidoreductase (nitroreductase family)